MATKPVRADSGMNMSTGTAAWNGPTGVGGIYYKTGVGLVMRKTDNSETTLGGGGGSTGNWTFSGNIADLTGAGAITIGGATATSISLAKAAISLVANTVFTGASSSTNTTALSVTTNVADGATSIAAKFNNTTSLTTAGAKVATWQNGGAEFAGFTVGALNLITSSLANFGVQNANGSGAVGQGTSLYLYSNNLGSIELLDANYFRPASDGRQPLGSIAQRWSGLYNNGPLSAKYTTQSGTTYTILASDHYVGLSNTAARTITLCAANAFAAGQELWVKDEACTAGTGNVTINRAGADTLVTTATGATSVVINTNGGKVGLVSDGVSKWMQVF